MADWRFALPPSLGREPIRALARKLADLLYDVGFVTVSPQETYGRLEEALASGEVDAAWCPPLACARIEKLGGSVGLRAIRWGATTYRSVLLCRAGDRLAAEGLAAVGRRPRAVWVDEHSMAGYILPRAYLASLGLDFRIALGSETLVGSYEACLHDVLEQNADLTAAFCSSAVAGRRASGHVELLGFRAGELKELAYTAECPNDGLALGPHLTPEQARDIRAALWQLTALAATREVLATAFDVDGFDVPPVGSYGQLLELEVPPRVI